MNNSTIVAPDIEQDISTSKKNNPAIVVYNDDYNSFQWVILSFIEILGHNLTQAEQCVMIIHNNGKCRVKTGDFDTLKPLKDGLVDRGISAVIEQ
jgi:ATP-dependent Clp protease adaptor protein ClpS